MCTLMVVLITCKNEEDPIKTEGARVLTTFSLYGDFFQTLKGRANSAVLGSIWPNFEPSEILMLPSLPARMKKM